jgi:hypothetical protein
MASSQSVAGVRLPRWWLPALSGVILVAGVIALLVALDAFGTGSTEQASKAPPGARTEKQVPSTPKTVPLSREARAAAIAWINSAVARTDLTKAWKLTAPELKRGYTLARWKAGTIPVVPYPVDKLPKGAVADALYKIDWSRPRDASLQILLGPVKGVKAQLFFIGIRRYGQGSKARWLVYDWQPRSAPAIPLGD